MISLGDHIYTELGKLATRVYHEQAPKDATFPYVTFNFPTSAPDEIREDFILTVDIWGKGPSTLALEQLVSSISRALDHTTFCDDDLCVRIYKDNTLAPPDPNLDIRRRQLRFECRTFYK